MKAYALQDYRILLHCGRLRGMGGAVRGAGQDALINCTSVSQQNRRDESSRYFKHCLSILWPFSGCNCVLLSSPCPAGAQCWIVSPWHVLLCCCSCLSVRSHQHLPKRAPNVLCSRHLLCSWQAKVSSGSPSVCAPGTFSNAVYFSTRFLLHSLSNRIWDFKASVEIMEWFGLEEN